MTDGGHVRWEEELGAYLLDALSPAEARAMEAHLAGCPRCQEDERRLQPSIAALAASVPQLAAPATLRESLLETVQAEAAAARAADPGARRPGRLLRWARPSIPSFRPAGALAAVALVVGGVTGYALSTGDTNTIRARATAAAPQAEATMIVRDGSAELVVDRLPAPRAGRVYQVWLRDGATIRPSTLFSVDRRGKGAAAIPGGLDEAVDEVMVSEEPAEGSLAPTTPPRLRVET